MCTRACMMRVCGFHAYVLGARRPRSVFTIPPVTYTPKPPERPPGREWIKKRLHVLRTERRSAARKKALLSFVTRGRGWTGKMNTA